uniref:Uncharacterized protein n=1 Tax=Cyclophora tenuis TaxID=216820 RepID=A0A7S1D040_CYCTE
MGRKQSQIQVVALLLLLVSALIMERILTIDFLLAREPINLQEMDAKHFTQGVAPILLASFISGLAGALCQKNLQGAGGGRNPYLFSMEICAASTIILLISLLFSADGQTIQENGFWHGWTSATMIPIFTNSVGGIIVGLVTKYAGSVRKGFALILGIFLSGLVQARVSNTQLVGGALAGISLWMHATNPPAPAPTTAKPIKQA